MDKPTILIVPGGFTLPELYSDVITHVASEGYSVQALHLPSVGYKTNVPGTMQDDAAFIASEISKHANEGKDVVLIAHSYGGLPATESTKGLSKVDRQRQGNSGGLVRLAYISCIILPVGESDASVIMPDNMLPRAAPFEIRFDVCLASCNLGVWG
jgi:Alpha/beta hydrolase family